MSLDELGIWALIVLCVVAAVVATRIDARANDRLFGLIRERETYRQRVRDKVASWEWVAEPDEDWPPFSLTCDEILEDARHG